MKRITDSQVIKHTDGGSHEQLYCFGHLWGPAYFRKGSEDYKEYLSIVQKLKAYEDTGLTPEEITELKEMREPKKALWEDSFYGGYACPACGEVFTVKRDSYCPCCGQEIDWETDI